MPDPVRVVLVEDNDVYREAVSFLLARVDGIELAGAVATGEAGVRAAEEHGADVAVVDFRLPDVDGNQVAAEIAERRPETAVVFLSASAGQQELEAARIAGVALVRKDDGVDALVAAIRAAAGGGSS